MLFARRSARRNTVVLKCCTRSKRSLSRYLRASSCNPPPTQAHKLTNCAAEWILEAEDYAKSLDTAAKDPSYEMGALFGIPFSDKESVAAKGYDSIMGYASEIGKPNTENSNVIAMLLEVGAYPFVSVFLRLDSC